MNLKNNRGMTHKSLMIIIIILIIIASVVVCGLRKIIKMQQLENLKTNMLLIQAKSKEYCEEASFKLGANPTEETRQKVEEYLNEKGISYEELKINIDKLNMENTEYIYVLLKDKLEAMGINNVESDEENGYYLVKYDLIEKAVEVYNTKGFTKDGITYFSLTDLQNL